MLNKKQLIYISHFLTLYDGGFKVSQLKTNEKLEMERLIVEVDRLSLDMTNGERV